LHVGRDLKQNQGSAYWWISLEIYADYALKFLFSLMANWHLRCGRRFVIHVNHAKDPSAINKTHNAFSSTNFIWLLAPSVKYWKRFFTCDCCELIRNILIVIVFFRVCFYLPILWHQLAIIHLRKRSKNLIPYSS